MYLNTLPKMCRSHGPLLARKILWVFYLVVALVFVQGVRLHVHVYDHDSDMLEHAHQEQVHFNYDTSETEPHNGVVTIDLSQQGFLKKLSFGSLVIALFVAVIVILSLRFLTQAPGRLDRHRPPASRPFSLRPPLRAPPL
jgi:hypothetical protein